MKVCIVGVGAIGGFLGARLAEAGCNVSTVARGATAAALRTHGLRVRSGSGIVSARVTVAEDPAALGAQDLVVVAVKGPAMADVAARIAPLLHADTMVLTAMNGVPWWFFHGFGGRFAGTRLQAIDPDGAIAAAIPDRHVVGCVVHLSCATAEPGLTRHVFGNQLIIGEPDGRTTPRMETLAATLVRAGFATTVSASIQSDIWYKLWGNMTMNPVSALTGATADRIIADPLVNRFCLDVMAEAAAIGTADRAKRRGTHRRRAQAGCVQDLDAAGCRGGQAGGTRRAGDRGPGNRRAGGDRHALYRRAAGIGPRPGAHARPVSVTSHMHNGAPRVAVPSTGKGQRHYHVDVDAADGATLADAGR